MGAARIIDSHIHCGVQYSRLPFDSIAPLLRQAGITEACLFELSSFYRTYQVS